jgi:hypothetical protein
MSLVHERLIRDALTEAEGDPEVAGVMLQGSLARGDGYPGSDLDLFVLLRDGCRRPFRAEERSGILVEWHYADFEKAAAKVRANPMLSYGYLDARVLRDDTGRLADLARVAGEVLAAYRTSPEERAGILHWLRSSRVKMAAAADAGDTLKAAFVASTTSWKILEGVWAVNDLPMPPSGTVLARRGDLERVPDGWESLFVRLFLGTDAADRVAAAREAIDWVLAQE